MRIERSINTVSWIPSDLLEGMGKMATRMKLAHHDPPPPDSLGDDPPAAIDRLRMQDGLRFANQLRAYIDVDDNGAITGSGYCGGGMIGATTIGHRRRLDHDSSRQAARSAERPRGQISRR